MLTGEIEAASVANMDSLAIAYHITEWIKLPNLNAVVDHIKSRVKESLKALSI